MPYNITIDTFQKEKGRTYGKGGPNLPSVYEYFATPVRANASGLVAESNGFK